MASVGSQLIAHFKSASRGANRGRNDHGVPIVFALLSMEPNSYDSSVASAAQNNGFDLRGLDALADRVTGVRAGSSFFNGFPASTTPSQLGNSNRRQIAILNGVRHSPGKAFLQILVNDHPDGALNTTEAAAMRVAINSVMSPDPYEWWAGEHGLTAENRHADLDPEGDGSTNIQEYFFGTHPLQASLPPSLVTEPDGPRFVFQRSKSAVLPPWVFETGTLPDQFTAWTPSPDDIAVMDDGDREIISIRLPAESRLFARLRITQ
jgi:hypothetical protein